MVATGFFSFVWYISIANLIFLQYANPSGIKLITLSAP